MPILPEVSRQYFKNIVRAHRPYDFELTPEFVAEVEAYRDEVREEEGGGGMCHIVTDHLAGKFGWERLFVSYLTPDGEIICGGRACHKHPSRRLYPRSYARSVRCKDFSVSHIKCDSDEIGRYRPVILRGLPSRSS